MQSSEKYLNSEKYNNPIYTYFEPENIFLFFFLGLYVMRKILPSHKLPFLIWLHIIHLNVLKFLFPSIYSPSSSHIQMHDVLCDYRA